MNKTFKVIFDRSRRIFVVASEFARGRTKSSSTGVSVQAATPPSRLLKRAVACV